MRRRRNVFIRFLGVLFTFGCVAILVLAGAGGFLIWQAAGSLPDYKNLADYKPAVMTRVHAGDGSLLEEFARERRVFVPVSAMPERLIQAFLSAEDKNFYQHSGVDWAGIARALMQNVQGVIGGSNRRFIGASTITQQVTKNFLLTSERTFDRKIKEALLALRLERAFSKEQILDLYLNQIFLGNGSYGVAAAALNYFGKSLSELDLAEMAYLAALPKAPANYNPVKNRERAVERRNWVLDRMAENGYITKDEHDDAVAKPLVVTARPVGPQSFAAESFTEEVRRELTDLYGEDKLYSEGYSVRTTLDPSLQIMARVALAAGLQKFDRSLGFRGPVTRLDPQGDWAKGLSAMPVPADVNPWRLAMVLDVSASEATIGLPGQENGTIPLKLLKWARKAAGESGRMGPEVKKASDVLAPGDVVYVAPATEGKANYHLVQMPQVDGAIVAMDPHTGRVLALVGGFSYAQSQFNRAVQALRQPGSSIKPFVYAAALDNGYTPSSVVMDAPVEIRMENGEIWKPENFTKKFYGPSTLRLGIEKSRNAMTVRLAHDLGMEKFCALVERLGIYDHLPPMPAMSLGAGVTSLLKITTGYSMLANGGKKIVPTLIDRVQDRYGRTIFRHDKRECTGCNAQSWTDQPEPEFIDQREEVINPYTSYQITSMLEGVVQRGTGQALKVVGKPVAGKTGTSNEEKDAWFIGYTPDLTVGVYVGFDKPRPMGEHATGGELAAPIAASFMRNALRDKPATPFRVPAGIQLIPIDPQTGQRAAYGDPNVILEAFKPGEGPPQDTVVIGVGDGSGNASIIEGGLTTGTGGLY